MIATYSMGKVLLTEREDLKKAFENLRIEAQKMTDKLQEEIDKEDRSIEASKSRVLEKIKKQDTYLALIDHFTQAIKEYE